MWPQLRSLMHQPLGPLPLSRVCSDELCCAMAASACLCMMETDRAPTAVLSLVCSVTPSVAGLDYVFILLVLTPCCPVSLPCTCTTSCCRPAVVGEKVE